MQNIFKERWIEQNKSYSSRLEKILMERGIDQNKSYSSRLRDGKLFVNPLHLPVEEVRYGDVKCF
jgi:hypothetical protein